MDNAIHRINRYPLDKYQRNKPRYPLDSDLSSGQRYPAFEQLGPGDLRVYIDPKPLSAALKRERYQIPVTDYVLSDMPRRVCFKEVDLIRSLVFGAGC